VFNVHNRRWRIQAWRSWNAKAELHGFDLVHVLRVQQVVEPLSNHSCRNSFIGMSNLGLVLPLTLPLVLTSVLTLVLTRVRALVLPLILTVAALALLLSLTMLELTLELTLNLIWGVVLSVLQWTYITMF